MKTWVVIASALIGFLAGYVGWFLALYPHIPSHLKLAMIGGAVVGIVIGLAVVSDYFRGDDRSQPPAA
jgi:hypothetical protein